MKHKLPRWRKDRAHSGASDADGARTSTSHTIDNPSSGSERVIPSTALSGHSESLSFESELDEGSVDIHRDMERGQGRDAHQDAHQDAPQESSSVDEDAYESQALADRPLWVPSPIVEMIPCVQLEVSARNSLDIRALERQEPLDDLIRDGKLLAPQMIEERGSNMIPRRALSFFPQSDHETLYEALFRCARRVESQAELTRLVLITLETFVELESAECPPLVLDHRHVWYNTERDQVQVWITARSEESWARSASTLITHTLMLCAEMSGEEMPTGDELLEVIDLLRNIEAINPRQVSALRRGLTERSLSCAALHNLWAQSRTTTTSSRSINKFERVADQRVGVEKYHKRVAEYLRVQEQQEDRYFESTLIVNGERYWLGAVLDGVSTCDYGSGAQIAQVGHDAIAEALRMIPEHEKLSVMVEERDPSVILDFVFNFLRKHVLNELKALIHEARVDLDDVTLHPPTSTATLALVDERGQVWIKWVGDSPVLVLTDRDELLTLCTSNCAQHEQISEGVEIGRAVKSEGAHALTADLSAIALNLSLGVDETRYQLTPHETLILCSDGLIDGFKDGRRRLGSDASALHAIAQWTRQMTETRQERDLYRIITGLCHEADQRRGVDNITALGMRPLWHERPSSDTTRYKDQPKGQPKGQPKERSARVSDEEAQVTRSSGKRRRNSSASRRGQERSHGESSSHASGRSRR